MQTNTELKKKKKLNLNILNMCIVYVKEIEIV